MNMVGLQLACAWILAQQLEEDETQQPSSLPSEIEQRLIAALDKLAYK
jgi:hypothetical protein